jgi:hypothetical protein
MLEETLAGTRPFRRLFLDAMVLEEQKGLTRKFHAATKYEGNPVVPRDKPWEGWGPYMYGTVMWDEGKLKMWYENIGGGYDGKLGHHICYAESADGIHWEKPELGIFEYAGSKKNNIIANLTCHIASIIKVPGAGSAGRKWACYSFGGAVGPHVVFSKDGIHWGWDAEPKYEKLFSSNDVCNFFYDPYTKCYIVTYKTGTRRHRAVGLAVSEDGFAWSKPLEQAIFCADDLDPDATQIYGMPVFPYQGCYIGQPWIHHSRNYKYGPYSAKRMYEAQEGSPCTMDVQLAWSWNLVNWTRTPDRRPFIALGNRRAFDRGQIYTARAPIVMGDELWFYYGGFCTRHDYNKGAKGEIGLAKLRLDGFCSMRAGSKEGWLISRRELFKTPKVMVNAVTRPDGCVVAELLDRNNNVLPGFARKDCVPFKGDSVAHALEWKTKSFPADLIEPDKKVRFYLVNADLYSYLPVDIWEDDYKKLE